MKPTRRGIPKIEFVFLTGLMLLGSACGRQIDPAFEPHLQAFLDLAESEGITLQNVNVEITFGTPPDNKQGVCFTNSQRIVIDRFNWETTFEAARRTLIFHELGHCLGNLKHAGETERSIMQVSSGVAANDYETNRQFYDHELMNRMKGTNE